MATKKVTKRVKPTEGRTTDDRHRPRTLDELKAEVGPYTQSVRFHRAHGGTYYHFYRDRIVRVYSDGTRYFHIEPVQGMSFKPVTVHGKKQAKELSSRIIQGLQPDVEQTAVSTPEPRAATVSQSANAFDAIDGIRAQIRKLEHSNADNPRALDLIDDLRSQLRQLEKLVQK